jgi:hypothetical protein
VRVAFSQSGSGREEEEEEESLQQLKFVHAPLLCSVLALAGSGWLWLAQRGPPQRPRPRPSTSTSTPTPTLRPSGPGAHLSCPQRPTVVARALAVTGCRAAARMGRKLSTARQQGALPLSKIAGLQHVLYSVLYVRSMHVCMYAREMGIMIHTVGVQTPRGVLRRAGGPGLTGCWTAFRTVSTVHQAHPLPVPRWAPLPSLPSLWPLARRPSKPQRLCLSLAR